MSGYRYNDTPTIMMKGKWLKKFGFKIGQEYHGHCQNRKLIITLFVD